MNLRTFHRTSAILIVIFASVHITNHLTSLFGVSTHIAFMDVARKVYRLKLVEVILLSCVLFQLISGLWFVIVSWKQRQGAVAWAQAISGAYLAFFLLVHVGAVLFGRTVLKLDTNFYYAAAGFHVPPYQFFFAPYYFLAVLALFTHVGCAIHWQLPEQSRLARRFAVWLPATMGGVISLLIVLSLAGMLQPVEIPANYKATYGQQGH